MSKRNLLRSFSEQLSPAKIFSRKRSSDDDSGGDNKRRKLTLSEESPSPNPRQVAQATKDAIAQRVSPDGYFNILGLFVRLSNDYLLDESKSPAQKFGCLWYYSWLLRESYSEWAEGDDEVSVRGHF